MGRKGREQLGNCPGTGLNHLRGGLIVLPLSGVTSRIFPSSPDDVVAAWSQAAGWGCCLVPEIVKAGRNWSVELDTKKAAVRGFGAVATRREQM